MIPRVAYAGALLGAVSLLAACSSADSARDDALAGLDRATEAAGLEAEMAALVGDLPLEPSQKEATAFEQSVQELDTEAGDLLASADTGEAYDGEITAATEQIQAAGVDVLAATKSENKLTAARKQAIDDLKGSNEKLRAAAGLIGAELEDEGELATEDADSLDALLSDVDRSGEAVSGAEDQLAAQEAEAAEQAAAEREAQEAAEAETQSSPAPAPSSGGCDRGLIPVRMPDGSVICAPVGES